MEPPTKSAPSFLESPSKIRTENYVHADALVNEDPKKRVFVSVSVHGKGGPWGVAILTRAPRTPNPPGVPVFIYLSLFSKNETGIPAHCPLNDSDWAMSWDPRDRPESGTEKEYCNKRALKGILEQKIKKIAAPAKIQIQKFDRREDNGQKNWEVGGGLAFFSAK